jgi:hypothetical protein
MNVKLVFLMLVFLSMLSARADEAKSKFDASASPKPDAAWNTSPAHWDEVISRKSTTTDLRLGKSDYVVSGVLVEGLRRRRSTQDRSLGKKILEFPIVRLFVPQPMPSPPGRGKYFRWGKSDLPWTAIAEGAAPGKIDNAVTHEANVSLISIHR